MRTQDHPTRRLGSPPIPLCPLCNDQTARLGVARIMQSEGQWETEAVTLYCNDHFIFVTDRAVVEEQTEYYLNNLKSFEPIMLKRDSLSTGLSVMGRGLRITLRGLFNLFFPLS